MGINIRKTVVDRNAETRLLIGKIEEAIHALNLVSLRALGLLRAQLDDTAARFEDDDDWRRMPRNSGRCPVSGWSRGTVERYAKLNRVRKKKVGGASYYAAKDVRAILNEQATPIPKHTEDGNHTQIQAPL